MPSRLGRQLLGAFSLAAMLCQPVPASAGLGASLSSVRSDGVRMAAQMSSTPMVAYTRHELTRPNGGQVLEYTDAKGQVFAVAWSGPGKPDLRALLGDSFARYQAASAARGASMRTLRRPVAASGGDLQIEAGGHMGWFHGVAVIPSLTPPGVSLQELRPAP